MPELCSFQTVPFGRCSLPPPQWKQKLALAVDKEIAILSHIARSEQVRQRDLSHVIGMSLGMTNAILKRLVHKGYLTIRKVNNRNIAYAVTPAGVEAIAKRSYRYFKRTIRNIVYYREAIEAFVHDIKSRGYQGIAFAGVSDLDFIVEHACEICGIRYLRDDASIEAATAGSDELYLLYSKSYIPDEEEKGTRPAAAFLQEVVSQGAGGRRRGGAVTWHSTRAFGTRQSGETEPVNQAELEEAIRLVQAVVRWAESQVRGSLPSTSQA